jgi:uncharacterized protein (TIGR00251 family)
MKTKGTPDRLPWKRTKAGLSLEVRVQPRASRLAVEGVEEGVLRVRLTAAPAEGAANEQLIRLLAAELGVPKSGIRIIKGKTSRNKVVAVEGIDGIPAR